MGLDRRRSPTRTWSVAAEQRWCSWALQARSTSALAAFWADRARTVSRPVRAVPGGLDRAQVRDDSRDRDHAPAHHKHGTGDRGPVIWGPMVLSSAALTAVY